MTQEQINQLAKEYAEYHIPFPNTQDEYSQLEEYERQAKSVLDWLSVSNLIRTTEKIMNNCYVKTFDIQNHDRKPNQ